MVYNIRISKWWQSSPTQCVCSLSHRIQFDYFKPVWMCGIIYSLSAVTQPHIMRILACCPRAGWGLERWKPLQHWDCWEGLRVQMNQRKSWEREEGERRSGGGGYPPDLNLSIHTQSQTRPQNTLCTGSQLLCTFVFQRANEALRTHECICNREASLT